jgi:antitoxin component YwqK of YwqJK toxin-antitoxin module
MCWNNAQRVGLLSAYAFLSSCGGATEPAATPASKPPVENRVKEEPTPPPLKPLVLDPEKRFPDHWWTDKRFTCPGGEALQSDLLHQSGIIYCGRDGSEEGPYVMLSLDHPVEEGWLHAAQRHGLNRKWQGASSGGLYLAEEWHYKDGVPDGTYHEYYENGREKLVKSYQQGVLQGAVIRYGSDGKELGRFEINDGNGKWSEWYDNGIKSKEGEIHHGIADGDWKQWDESGAPVETSKLQNGATLESTRYEQGKPVRKTSFRRDGGTASVVDIDAEGRANGPATTYFSSGARETQGQYRQGKKEGRWTVFAESGDVVATETYRVDRRVNRKKGGKAPVPHAGHPSGAVGTGIAACDRYLLRLANCANMPAEAKQGLNRSFVAWRIAREQARKAGGDTERQWTEQMTKTCEQASQGWEATLKAQGC